MNKLLEVELRTVSITYKFQARQKMKERIQ